MSRLSPQVLVQYSRRMVQSEWKWKPTREHAPPVPNGVVTDDPVAELAPLDVRLIQELGFRAFYDETSGSSAWPLPFGCTPHELALFGKEHGILHEEPQRGDLFLQRSFYGKEYVHAGIVMTVDGSGFLDDQTLYFDTSTIEGDTDHRGILERGYTCKLRRRLSPSLGDQFLRWCELDIDAMSGRAA